jgi:uncharacterized membrane protein (DUF485 family)
MHDHENIREEEHPQLVTRNTRLGLVLFTLYCLLYGGFIGMSLFAPGLMKSQPFGGVNLAILYGFALIVAALVLAVIYLVLAGRAHKDA